MSLVRMHGGRPLARGTSILGAAIGLVLFLAPHAGAHEPVFGIGPQTLFQGGIGVEEEWEFIKKGTLLKDGDDVSDPQDREMRVNVLATEVAYGITSDLTATVALPLVKKRFTNIVDGVRRKEISEGLGDVGLRMKYRFYRKDEVKARDHWATVVGVKFPTGSDSETDSQGRLLDHTLQLGSGSWDFLVGLTGAKDSRRLYLWGDVLYKITTEARGFEAGDELNFDAAVGLRPYLPEYLEPDLVLVAELNGELSGKNEEQGVKDPDSGGVSLFVAPGFMLAYRNWMVKGAIQFPIFQELNGSQLGVDYRSVLGLEYHY
ncbi:MAG: hypothetical protein IH975_09595 [Nitrospinae bacterium]|nr:hypothetical protein [Nitrospinota bacterium]